MSRIVCKSCGSDRCGNHAACARRKSQENERAREHDVDWATLHAYIYISMRRAQRLTEQEEIAEIKQIEKENPLLFTVLNEYALLRREAIIHHMMERLSGY